MATDLRIEAENRTGQLAGIGAVLGNAGVNIEAAYLATDTRLVFAVDDPVAAEAAL